MAEEYNEITWIGDGVHCHYMMESIKDLKQNTDTPLDRKAFHSHKSQMQKKEAVNTLVFNRLANLIGIQALMLPNGWWFWASNSYPAGSTQGQFIILKQVIDSFDFNFFKN